MLTLVLTGYYIGREGDFLTSVAVAALLLVGFNPLVVDELGFQLSFTAVVLLCTFEPIFSERFYPFISDKLHWIPAPILHRFSITVFASVVIGIGMLPVVAYHFNIISLVFPIANLIVVPLLSCVLASAFAMLLAGMIWLKAAVVFGLVTEAFAWIIFATVKVCSLVPGGSMRIPSPPLWMLGLEATAILLMWWQSRPSRRVAAFMAAALLVVAASYAAATLDAPTLRATFLDVGDSDSCLVEFPAGETMLVDTGFATRYLDCGEHLIAPLLWNKGLTTVDVLLLTHPDADHTGGAAFLIENFEVGRILLPVLTDAGRFSPVLHVAAENECAVARTASGDELPGFRDVRIEVLNPPSNRPYEYLSDNDTSVVIRITYGDTNLLLTGDAGKKAFRHMEGTGQEVASEVLKAPHHGLKSGFNETFLKAANPEVVVISGRTHRRNQDMEERIARYAPFCKTVLSTSDCGAIVIETDGGEIRTKLTRNGRGNPL
jgi:competence protein ComEC